MISQIHSFLLSEELARHLRLDDQGYVILLPKKLLQNYNFESLTFTLSIINNKITLVGPIVKPSHRVKSPAREIIHE